MKLTILLLFLPTVLAAQVNASVHPIISQDYTEQVRKLRSSIDPVDSVAYKRNTMLKLKGQFYAGMKVSRLKIADGFAEVSPAFTRTLKLSGSYSGTIELKTHNRLPELQNTYAQGRSSNGSFIWRGPETGELFSYGPALSNLEFDGSNYPYDRSGKLTPAGSGNGKPATAYKEDIFRTAVVHSHQLKIESELLRYGKHTWNFNLRLGHGNEQNIVRENKGSFSNLITELGTSIKWITIKGTYRYAHDERTTVNRNGLLNRAYQYSLLTPASFSNEQGTTLGNTQRSYSNMADNPWYLLRDNNNRYNWKEHNGGLFLTFRTRNWDAGIQQTLLSVKERHTERYRPGTVSWTDGMYTDRNRSNLHYLVQSNIDRNIEYDNYNFKSKVSLLHNYNNIHTAIRYQPDNNDYDYRRSSHDLFLSMENSYSKGDVTVKIITGNKAYISNTSTKNNFFLPTINLGLNLSNLPYDLRMDIYSSYHIVNSELALDKSMSYIDLLQYNVAQSSSYRPMTEVSSYRQLAPVRNREWNGGLSLYFRQHVSLTGNAFIKDIRDDVFPVYENGNLTLKNLADLRSKGVDISLFLSNLRLAKGLYLNNNLSVSSYRTNVTKVRDGYNYTPVAGFRDLHKALVEGQPLGVIVGSHYLRDAAGNMIIGADGFPLADAAPKVIGNTIPDFVVKMSNNISWRRFGLETNLEWKKGGQMWNGTQAALDYYGRSATSGAERSISGYVFQGITTDGHANEIPVKFYDPAQAVETNRWTRYGITGVAEQYIQKADYLRLNAVSVSYRMNLNKGKQHLHLSSYVHNILLWSPYKGADPDQTLYDQSNASGLDFFNLPAVKTYGFNVTYQF